MIGIEGSILEPQNLRILILKTIAGMVFGTRNLNYWVLGPSRVYQASQALLLQEVPSGTCIAAGRITIGYLDLLGKM